ncbi:MAG: glycosyltransferase family 2 protein [Saprospiraceae bacterium]|nr:glycosyltransferase family 2 protein [Saprospiraceae bacterium]
MEKISAVIIAKNEENNIARCLQSLIGIVDEMLVVDSESTDKTAKLASDLGAKVIQHPFEGYYQQKNVALDAACYDFVLSLDADEALSPELQDEILKVKNDPRYDAYVVKRKNNYCGQWIRHGGWYPDKKLRLWDKAKGRWGGGNPHEKVIMEQPFSVKELKGDLLHYAYRSEDELLKKMELYADMGATSAFEAGKKISFPMVLLKTGFKFFRDYILKLGFLDGNVGYTIAKHSAYEKFLKYSNLNKMNKDKTKVG